MPRDLVRGRREDGATEANTSCMMWLYMHFFLPPDSGKLMLSATRTEGGRKITSKCQTVHFAGCLALTEGF